MARYWVQIPGRPKPVEMALEELAEQQRAGKLPAGTVAAKFGEEAWSAVDVIPEVRAYEAPRSSLEAPPPSSSAAGVDLAEPPPTLGPSLLGEHAAPKKAARSFRFTRKLAAILVAVAVVLGCGGVLLCAWYRLGYTHGVVFEHVPADCDRFEYVDFAAIDASKVVKGVRDRRLTALADWLEDGDREDGIHPDPTDDDAHGRVATARALDKLGVHPYGDVKEVVYCERHDGPSVERMVAIGGAFRGRDVLKAMREALLHRDRRYKDEKLSIDDYDGHPYLKIDDARSATMATNQVVLVGPRRMIEQLLDAKPVAREYAIGANDVIVRKLPGSVDERYGFKGDDIAFERRAPGDDDALKGAKDALEEAEKRVKKVPGLDALARAYGEADARLDDKDLVVTITWSQGDVADAVGSIFDYDRGHLAPVIAALKAAPGSEIVHHAVLPGVDYFDLRLSPW